MTSNTRVSFYPLESVRLLENMVQIQDSRDPRIFHTIGSIAAPPEPIIKTVEVEVVKTIEPTLSDVFELLGKTIVEMKQRIEGLEEKVAQHKAADIELESLDDKIAAWFEQNFDIDDYTSDIESVVDDVVGNMDLEEKIDIDEKIHEAISDSDIRSIVREIIRDGDFEISFR